MSKKKKAAKGKRNLRGQALADIKKLELDLKKVKKDILQIPHCPTHGTGCKPFKAD
jgi:hypothetical protein